MKVSKKGDSAFSEFLYSDLHDDLKDLKGIRKIVWVLRADEDGHHPCGLRVYAEPMDLTQDGGHFVEEVCATVGYYQRVCGVEVATVAVSPYLVIIGRAFPQCAEAEKTAMQLHTTSPTDHPNERVADLKHQLCRLLDKYTKPDWKEITEDVATLAAKSAMDDGSAMQAHDGLMLATHKSVDRIVGKYTNTGDNT